MRDEADDADDMDEGAEDAKPSKGKDKNEALFRRLQRQYRVDRRHWEKWRRQAEEDFYYYAGEQWTDEDKRKLEDMSRPALVFNRVAPLVNAVVGAEVNNRREVRYIPREQGDAIKDELLTSAAEWFRDLADAEDEDSNAFQDTVIAGLGWTETRLDFDENPDGDPLISRIDPFEMIPDSRAVKPNLVDAKRVWRVRDIDHEEAEEMFPKATRTKLHAGWAAQFDKSGPHDQDKSDQYANEDNDEGAKPSMCRIVECQWIDYEEYWRVPDPESGDIVEKDEKQKKLLDKLASTAGMPEWPGSKARRKVVKRAWLGGDGVLEMDTPMTPSGLFTYQAITGYYNKKQGVFYGMVRGAKDPQNWANKWLSQVMHILNSQAKGGIIAERDAFEDQREAEQTYARAEAITWARKGAIQNGSIMPKPAPQLPVGFMQLMSEAKNAISEVTGLSPEFLGTREANQPGVLEYQRRQSSLNLLAGLFDALRRYRKAQGRILLHLIQKHLADGRLVKIVGDDKAQYVPLMSEQFADKEFDIIVDDAPSSPNEKEKTWQIITAILPMLKDYMTPEVALEIANYSPLPPSLVERIKDAAKKAQEANAPKQEAQEQAAMQAAAVETEAKAAKADLDGARAEEVRIKNAKDMLELQYGAPAAPEGRNPST